MVGILFCLTIKKPLVKSLSPLFKVVPWTTFELKLNLIPIGLIGESPVNISALLFILNTPFVFSLVPSIKLSSLNSISASIVSIVFWTVNFTSWDNSFIPLILNTGESE